MPTRMSTSTAANTEPLVWKSTIASLAVQLVVGGITVWGLTISSSARLLNTSLWLEAVSQAIEFLWYASVVCYFGRIRTWMRYIDWVFSTPIMIVSTALFLAHRSSDNIDTRIVPALTLNAAMLACGFATETGAIGPVCGLGLGGLFFVGSFSFLATYVDKDDALSVALFFIMFGVWGLYGIAAAFPYAPKNVAYNALDVVSKNFYGVFLTFYLLYDRND